MKISIYLLLPLIVADLSEAQDECPENFTCTSYHDCDETRLNNGLIYPCPNGMCCPIKSTVRSSEPIDLFPKNCGISSDSNRIIGGQNASIGQFPWMALLGYKTRGIDIIQYLCGGTLITENYVLTAAHCLIIHRLQLEFVRLGELDLKSDVDCVNMFNTTICADPYIDVPIALTIVHEGYNATSLKNDIGLIKLALRIKFTEYVHPICLPFSFDFDPNQSNKVVVTGWGKTNNDHLGGASHLQFASLNIWNERNCSNFVKPSVETQLCASGPKDEDSCKGDSGGPIIKAKNVDFVLRNYQLGIVSYLPVIVCGDSSVPTIYTRVDKYLDWIVDKVKQ